MKLKKTVWKTDDDCTSCGHQGMIFEADEEGSDSLNIHYGWLSCPACGERSRSYGYDYQVPQEARA